jgi:uroporphyrinogen-III synthase
MQEASKKALQGLRVATFESRRSAEICEMIRRHGGEPVSAPALQEVPLPRNGPILDFVHRLRAGEIDVAIFLTGVGTRFLFEAAAPLIPATDLAVALRAITTVARGPKPTAALKEAGISPTISVPEPNTWRELLAAIDGQVQLAGKRVAIQEYGAENPALLGGLTDRGAVILRVPVYRWELPSDTGPLREAIRLILDGEIDIAIFTTSIQLKHLLLVEGGDRSARLKDALQRIVLASIGPMCSDALKEQGLSVDIEPEHPKMGYLISAVAKQGATLVKAKRKRAGLISRSPHSGPNA